MAEAGDFDKDQAFSCSAWVKLSANDSSGAIVARMDDEHDYRGWDFWVEGRRVGMHLVHRWSEDALKVVSAAQVPAGQWTHVTVTYDGSQKAAGVKVYFNGQPQATNVQADKLQNTIRTDVPFKIGQRNKSNPLSGAALQDLRIFARSLAPREVDSLARATRFASIVAKPAAERSDAEKLEVYGWWLPTFDKGLSGTHGAN